MLSHSNSTAGFSFRENLFFQWKHNDSKTLKDKFIIYQWMSLDCQFPRNWKCVFFYFIFIFFACCSGEKERKTSKQENTPSLLYVTKGSATWRLQHSGPCVCSAIWHDHLVSLLPGVVGTTRHHFQPETVMWSAVNKGLNMLFCGDSQWWAWKQFHAGKSAKGK